jgi:hypothetical protein
MPSPKTPGAVENFRVCGDSVLGVREFWEDLGAVAAAAARSPLETTDSAEAKAMLF